MTGPACTWDVDGVEVSPIQQRAVMRDLHRALVDPQLDGVVLARALYTGEWKKGWDSAVECVDARIEHLTSHIEGLAAAVTPVPAGTSAGGELADAVARLRGFRDVCEAADAGDGWLETPLTRVRQLGVDLRLVLAATPSAAAATGDDVDFMLAMSPARCEQHGDYAVFTEGGPPPACPWCEIDRLRVAPASGDLAEALTAIIAALNDIPLDSSDPRAVTGFRHARQAVTRARRSAATLAPAPRSEEPASGDVGACGQCGCAGFAPTSVVVAGASAWARQCSCGHARLAHDAPGGENESERRVRLGIGDGLDHAVAADRPGGASCLLAPRGEGETERADAGEVPELWWHPERGVLLRLGVVDGIDYGWCEIEWRSSYVDALPVGSVRLVAAPSVPVDGDGSADGGEPS